MNERQIKELVSFGAMIEIKVTPFYLNGRMGVNVRDLEFFSFIPAALYLKQIQSLELPECSEYLVA